ncbi:MAG: anhydro-N-acetylmuramic acid kinase [Planctomycetota bacterium]
MTGERDDAVHERFALGCMSGTSLDGLDVVLVRLTGRRHALAAQVVRHAATPFEDGLRDELTALASDRPTPPSDIARIARELGDLHADLCESTVEGLETAVGSRIAFVVAHGQTITHHPTSVAGSDRGFTWQLLDPFPIAHRLGVRVCTDLRGADLVAGGEGAPITPAADPVLFPVDRAIVVNLGGIANATRWRRVVDPSDAEPLVTIEGADTGPCNLLLDPLASALLHGARYDADGQVASEGRSRAELVDAIDAAIDRGLTTSDGIAPSRPRSLGREQFGRQMIEQVMQVASAMGATPADVLASAVDTVAGRIARWCSAGDTADVILAGGGVRNRALVTRLTARMPEARVKTSSDYGVAPEAREAAAMAVLGAMSLDGLSITVPSITGATQPGPAGRWTLARDTLCEP